MPSLWPYIVEDLDLEHAYHRRDGFSQITSCHIQSPVNKRCLQTLRSRSEPLQEKSGMCVSSDAQRHIYNDETFCIGKQGLQKDTCGFDTRKTDHVFFSQKDFEIRAVFGHRRMTYPKASTVSTPFGKVMYYWRGGRRGDGET